MKTLRDVYRSIRKITDKGHRILEVLSGGFLGLSAVVILFQVFYRFVIVQFVSFSFPFTEEFARYLIIWSTYLILGVCLKEGMHATVDVLAKKLTNRGKIINYAVIRLVMVFFLITVLIVSKDLILMMARFKTPTLRWPSHRFYLSVVFGCISMLWETLLEVFGVLVGEVEPLLSIMEEVE